MSTSQSLLISLQMVQRTFSLIEPLTRPRHAGHGHGSGIERETAMNLDRGSISGQVFVTKSEAVLMRVLRRRMARWAGRILFAFATAQFFSTVALLCVGARPVVCAFTACSSIFPALIATACFSPRKRRMILRLVGCFVLTVSVGTFVVSLLEPPNVPVSYCLLLATAAAGVGMILNGRWPRKESQDIQLGNLQYEVPELALATNGFATSNQ